jgi:hypothetical protein
VSWLAASALQCAGKFDSDRKRRNSQLANIKFLLVRQSEDGPRHRKLFEPSPPQGSLHRRVRNHLLSSMFPNIPPRETPCSESSPALISTTRLRASEPTPFESQSLARQRLHAPETLSSNHSLLTGGIEVIVQWAGKKTWTPNLVTHRKQGSEREVIG